MKHIEIPKYFDHYNFSVAIDFQKSILREVKKKPEDITFDLSENQYISTLGVLLIAQMSDQFMENKCKCWIHYGKPKKESKRAWFVRTMGLVESKPNKAVEEYLDSFRVKVQRCFNAKDSLDAVNKVIPIIKSEFNPPENTLKALNWALWELVDNAGIHGYGAYGEGELSYKKPVYFCAFDYRDTIDIAILDVGQGIRNSFLLSGKEKYKEIGNERALRLSVQDQESGHPKGSPGFGLFGCSEIAKQSKGELVVLSGDSALIVSEKGLDVLPLAEFGGTMVSLSIPQEAVVNLEEIFGKDSSIVIESIDDLIGDFNG